MRLIIFLGLFFSCSHPPKTTKSSRELCRKAGFYIFMGDVYKCELKNGMYSCYLTPGRPEVCQGVEEEEDE